jgi:DNA polymerase sigma
VDISLNQVNGIAAGKIVNQYLDILPGARQMILVVKAFLSQRSMNEVYTGGLGSYSVICLVISFLQVSRLNSQRFGADGRYIRNYVVMRSIQNRTWGRY